MHQRARTAAVVLAVLLAPAPPALSRGADEPAAVTLPDNVFNGPPEDPGQLEAKKAQRLQKIQQLAFDRRPATILKAWASPDEFEDKESEPPPNNGMPFQSPPPTVFAPEEPTAPRTGGQAVEPLPDGHESAGEMIVAAPGVPARPDPFDAELKSFRRMVTLGDWAGVKAFLAKLSADEGKAAYKRLVQTLPSGAAGPAQNGMQSGQMMPPQLQIQMMMQANQGQEKNSLGNGDVIGLMAAAPRGLEDGDLVEGLGQALRAAIDQGSAVEDFLTRVRTAVAPDDPKRKPAVTRRDAARVLAAAGCAAEAGAFLPGTARALADDDREALNLLSRHFLALYEKEKRPAALESAWEATQAVLSAGKVERKAKNEALTRAVELAPKVRAELGRAWLEESFTRRPGRGMEVIAAIGAASSRGLQTHASDADFRKKALDLQKTAVEALLKADPRRASEWSQSLTLLASAWLAEADFSREFDQSTSLGPRMQRDAFGNVFFQNDDGADQQAVPQNQNAPRPVRVADALDSRPGDAWLDRLDPGLRPRFAAAYSQLYLKVGEDALAFPYIERLAATHPARAGALAEEFVRVWTRNHDPNAERNRTNPYMFMFGFERKAEGVPLTRSKQERNLRELAGWVRRLRALPTAGLDEKLLAAAFTTCHSAAEVYRVDAIEAVFGSIDGLKPETLAALAQQMRGNLFGVWRKPEVQEQNKTRRKEKDIRAEVVRGYEVARGVIDRGLEKHPDHWGLELARAALLHDENNYLQEIEPNLNYSKVRGEALARFRKAASLYARTLPGLAEDQESNQPFDLWFYASLGACDLPGLDERSIPDVRQPALIRQAILALPGPAADRHMGRFANDLFTRMSGINPAVKFRYLRGGFDVVGGHKQAAEARKVYDYYKDLVTEIKLDAAVDGPTSVGHGRPFGVFVNLRHTREIERESGGFGRYLQNQNQGNNNAFSYNYGRPLENYRDKFQEAAVKALNEQFQVVSVTFQDEKVNSRAVAEYGWRVTPYAYLLLKARSPEVDKVAPLRLDLDFLDTSGYVVLPVESPALPVDAAAGSPPTRPFAKLKITQTLDERQAKDGKLILDVKAVSQGIVPELADVLDLRSPGFRVVKTEDQPLSVSRFDPDADANTVISDRGWLVTMQADDGLSKPPASFWFAAARVDGAEMAYQRYVDADLAPVGPVVALEERYGRPSRAWAGWSVAGVVFAGLAVIAARRRARPRAGATPADRYRVPEPVTPFSVLGLLRDIQVDNGLPEAGKRDLAASIGRLERHYFADSSTEEPDLRAIAETWVRHSR